MLMEEGTGICDVGASHIGFEVIEGTAEETKDTGRSGGKLIRIARSLRSLRWYLESEYNERSYRRRKTPFITEKVGMSNCLEGDVMDEAGPLPLR
jgi:hypothetical protein